MPTKTTKKSSIKDKTIDLKVNKSDSKTSSTKTTKKTEKKNSQKVVVKRRKLDLTPTRASAIAIVSQANREKKQALIERMESGKSIPKNRKAKDDTKIPLWVRIFFGCSLLLFCISFYQAVFRPAIENDIIDPNLESDVYWVSGDDSESNVDDVEEYEHLDNVGEVKEGQVIQNDEVGKTLDWSPTIVTDTIQEYFSRISNRQFDYASNLLIPALRNSPEMLEHFTLFRMNPFLDGIEGGKLTPTNFKYISTSTFGRDRYSFELSYVLKSNQEKYDEVWEAVVDTKGDEPRITSIICTTSRCSYHPIFWPENFGLIR